jgi:hypothetical protein
LRSLKGCTPASCPMQRCWRSPIGMAEISRLKITSLAAIHFAIDTSALVVGSSKR